MPRFDSDFHHRLNKIARPFPIAHSKPVNCIMNRIILAIFALLTAATAQAQFFSFGLKGGVNSQLKNPKDISVGSLDTAFNFGVKDAKFGTQFGGYLRFGNKIFLQPELLFNSNRTDYQIQKGSMPQVFREKYQNLDMPVLVGFKAGPFRVHGGPVGHLFLNSKSELTDIAGYEENFKSMTWGWLGGVNVGLGRFSVDLRYEGNFNKQGDHISFGGQQFNFANTPARFLLNVNFRII